MEPEQLNNLKAFRELWEEEAGESLLDLRAPLGLILNDVAGALMLEPADRLAFLGETLAADIEEYLTPPIHLERQLTVNWETQRPRVTVFRGTTARRYWPTEASLNRALQLAAE